MGLVGHSPIKPPPCYSRFENKGGVNSRMTDLGQIFSPPQAENLSIFEPEIVISLRKIAFLDCKIAIFPPAAGLFSFSTIMKWLQTARRSSSSCKLVEALMLIHQKALKTKEICSYYNHPWSRRPPVLRELTVPPEPLAKPK